MTANEEYQIVKDRILFLEYQPGEVLKERELMEEFGCSRTPIREAFIRLNVEGLVNILPKSGTYVSEINYQDLKENFQVRKYLSPLAGELTAQNIAADETTKVEGLIKEFQEEEDPDRQLRIDLKLHKLINQATHNEQPGSSDE